MSVRMSGCDASGMTDEEFKIWTTGWMDGCDLKSALQAPHVVVHTSWQALDVGVCAHVRVYACGWTHDVAAACDVVGECNEVHARVVQSVSSQAKRHEWGGGLARRESGMQVRYGSARSCVS
jgi:hypothetical protein